MGRTFLLMCLENNVLAIYHFLRELSMKKMYACLCIGFLVSGCTGTSSVVSSLSLENEFIPNKTILYINNSNDGLERNEYNEIFKRKLTEQGFMVTYDVTQTVYELRYEYISNNQRGGPLC